jgi:hypothetical protein
VTSSVYFAGVTIWPIPALLTVSRISAASLRARSAASPPPPAPARCPESILDYYSEPVHSRGSASSAWPRPLRVSRGERASRGERRERLRRHQRSRCDRSAQKSGRTQVSYMFDCGEEPLNFKSGTNQERSYQMSSCHVITLQNSRFKIWCSTLRGTRQDKYEKKERKGEERGG